MKAKLCQMAYLFLVVWMMPMMREARAEESQTSTSVDSNTASPSLKDRLALSYYGVFYGPSFSRHVPVGYNPTVDGNAGDPVNFDSLITAGLRFGRGITVGMGVPFLFGPTSGREITMKDIFLKFSDTKLVSSGGFDLSVGARLYLPTTQVSQNHGFVAGSRLEQNLTYQPPGSPLTIGAFTYVIFNAYSDRGTGGTPLTLYVAPNLSYQFTPRLAGTLWSDLIQLKQARGSSLSSMRNDPVDIEPGLNWDMNSKVSFNPYINIYPQNLSWRATSFGMIISAKAL